MRTRRHVPLTRHRTHTLVASRYPFLALVVVLLLAPIIVSSPAPIRAASDVVTTCASNGPGSLPDLIAAAALNATITFAQDCPDATPITLTNRLSPLTNVTIDATTPPHTVTISGGDRVQLFFVDRSATLGLRGLTLAHGFSDAISDRNPGTVIISSVGASRYLAEQGNGGAIVNFGTVNVVGSTFSSNTSGTGGAIANAGTINVAGSTFSGNAATGDLYGGGAIINSGTVNVANGTFSGNTAKEAGAIFNGYGTVNVVGSTFSGNVPTRGGGAILNYGGPLLLTLSVVAGNTSGHGPDITYDVSTDGGGNVIGDAIESRGLTTLSDKLNLDPLLTPLGSYGGTVQTFALLPGSSAIAIAPCPIDPITGATLATDARGMPRPQGEYCDAGSYQTPTGL